MSVSKIHESSEVLTMPFTFGYARDLHQLLAGNFPEIEGFDYMSKEQSSGEVCNSDPFHFEYGFLRFDTHHDKKVEYRELEYMTCSYESLCFSFEEIGVMNISINDGCVFSIDDSDNEVVMIANGMRNDLARLGIHLRPVQTKSAQYFEFHGSIAFTSHEDLLQKVAEILKHYKATTAPIF